MVQPILPTCILPFVTIVVLLTNCVHLQKLISLFIHFPKSGLVYCALQGISNWCWVVFISNVLILCVSRFFLITKKKLLVFCIETLRNFSATNSMQWRLNYCFLVLIQLKKHIWIFIATCLSKKKKKKSWLFRRIQTTQTLKPEHHKQNAI